jgi:hypothetical protein
MYFKFDSRGNWVLQNSWKLPDKKDTTILEQLIETVGGKVIREEK